MRALVPWNAFRELASWHRDIDELFNRFFGSLLSEHESATWATRWLPAVESFRKDGQYVIRLDLPGVDPKDVEISASGDSLIIRGERKRTHEVNEKDYHYRETAYGRFERAFALPKGVDKDRISARYRNGVLEIAMPVPASEVGRKVPIQIGSDDERELKAA